ncbi:MAG TPA: hypothetical protein VGW38_15385 [Chloroflexota bacterium]|nr:hypothetical protein [Chloroflexota bacterium]
MERVRQASRSCLLMMALVLAAVSVVATGVEGSRDSGTDHTTAW